MRKVMLLCNAGMSSSLMAKKATEYMKEIQKDIYVEATTTASASDVFENPDYEMILISPQVRMLYDEYSQKANEYGKKIAQLSFDAYSPTSIGVKKMADIILTELD